MFIYLRKTKSEVIERIPIITHKLFIKYLVLLTKVNLSGFFRNTVLDLFIFILE